MYISSGHLRELSGRDTPGVGTYNTSKAYSASSHATHGSRFGRAERPITQTFFPSSPEPTPGHEYDQSSKLCYGSPRESSFPRSARSLHQVERQPHLGPGIYTPDKSSRLFPGRTFGLSYNALRTMSFPGLDRERLGRGSWAIGGYNPRFASATVSVSFARDKRHNWFDRASVANPVGPGAYNRDGKRDISSPRFHQPVKPSPRLEFKKWKAMRQT